METSIWIIQIILAFVFIVSGISKTFLPENKLVAMGQTGVEGLKASNIKFIGLSELLGAAGLVLPVYLNIFPVLTALAAFGLGTIMILAAGVHYRREEYKVIFVNLILLSFCALVFWFRIVHGE